MNMDNRTQNVGILKYCLEECLVCEFEALTLRLMIKN